MASTASARQPEAPDHETDWASRLFSPAAAEFWWLAIPRRLRAYSTLLWAAWTDGMYLTVWPRAAAALPLAVLLLGFVEGSTHWSPLTIEGAHLSTTVTAVSFMQIFHLLFLAVLLGSLSADLGLMLVAGFALGEYLIAGPFLTLGSWTPLAGFFCLRLPMFYSYAIFFALAVVPTVFGSAMLMPLTRKLLKDNLASIVIRVAASALVQFLLVYGWVLVAPMTLRLVWTWAGQTPPLNPTDYSSVLNPWLPLAASMGVILRAFLVRRAVSDPLLQDRRRRLWQEARDADQNPAWTRRQPLPLRIIAASVACTLLIAGLIASWWLAALVLVALTGIGVLRMWLLPRLGPWTKWAGLINRVPVIFRLAAAVAAGYFITLELLQLPGWGVRENGNPGHFEAELACFGVGLLIMVLLLPYAPRGAGGFVKAAAPAIPGPVGTAARVLLFLGVLGTGAKAYAICADPACCFNNNNDAAFTEALFFLAAGFLFLSGAALLLGLGLEAAAAASAADLALGDTALAETISEGVEAVTFPPP